ncbi:Uncharacterised protein [uncultured archaeon]|nr:Uncharacterised protein [uncultured archaeon]
MQPELIARVDKLLDEFMAVVDALAEERHLQRGIARSQLPNSMVAILGRDQLTILAQFRMENRYASYYNNPKVSLTPQQAANSAQWEFGMDDAFIIQFPASLLDQSPKERLAALQEVSGRHIDSEFQRLVQLLSLMRTRPIFGQAMQSLGARSALLLLPREAENGKNSEAIIRTADALGLDAYGPEDIRSGKSAIRELWNYINEATVIIADLTGSDPEVMYGLGIAHTIGKVTILIHPQGSKYLTDIPRTHGIEYEDSEEGRLKLEEQLLGTLRSMLAPVAE